MICGLPESAFSSHNNYPKLERRVRRVEREHLQRKGIRPAQRRWVICVETTAIRIPAWALLRREKRLSVGHHQVWFRGRNNGRAKMLADQDCAAGGEPVVTAVEYRVCLRCGRVLLQHEAQRRREMDESFPQGREMPCGPECTARR